MVWCGTCRKWNPHPCDRCARLPNPSELSRGPASDAGNTLELPHTDRPRAVPRAPAQGDDPAREPHITVDTSHGTATQLASLAGDDAEDLDLPGAPLTADNSDDNVERGTETIPQGPQAGKPPRAGN